jgi:hypothetical protein
MSTSVMTPKFRVSYPSVFKPRRNNLSQKDEYSVQALFAKGQDLTELKKAVQAEVEKKWGTDRSKWPKNLKLPFKDQGDREKEVDGKMILPDGYEKGAVYLNLKSTRQPGLVDQKKQDILDETQFYAGCYARAVVSVFAFDKSGSRGVSLGLEHLQKMADGEPFSGRPSAESAFTAIEGAEDGASGEDLFGTI